MSLDLNCADFIDDMGNKLKFPPEGLKQHPQKLDKKSIRQTIEKGIGTLKDGVLNNSEKELRAYLAKYDPEKLKEYESKNVREASDEGR